MKKELTSIFWMIALIVFVRLFIVEPFKIPSGSMIPTLLIGDHLFVAKSSYDIGIPFTNIKLLHVADPRRGDVVVFEYPNHEQSSDKEGIYYIKRIIGLPGDRISVRGGVPTINGVEASVNFLGQGSPEATLPGWPEQEGYRIFRELLPGLTSPHLAQQKPARSSDLPLVLQQLQAETGKDCIEVGSGSSRQSFFGANLLSEICPFEVPAGQYFTMGDNRDESADGREWGFVERKLLKGRALFIWLSLMQDDSTPEEGGPLLRWSRLGLKIN